MQQMIKKLFWIALLTAGWQAAWAYSLLGPVGAGEDASEQVTEIGYNPLGLGTAPPFFTDTQPSGPRNLGEGYRLNTPVLYYTFDPSFGYFGANGETAVQQAFDTMNTLTNVDSYSTNLTEFPLNSESINYQAQVLELADVKSTTLSMILEEMGLADPVRYTWVLLDRYNPPGATCPQGGPPLGYQYIVAQRNFDITATPLNFNAPDVGQYSPYVNAELYSYFIFDNCDLAGASPPTADALEIPVDPLNNNPPVASGHGEDLLPLGAFYTGLTRDDVAGLRYLMSSNNVFAPGTGYLETSAGGSVATSGGGGGGGTPFSLTTSSLADLSLDPTTLQALIPGIVITSVVTNIVNGLTNFVYTFGNVVVFSSTTNTTVQILTTNVAPVIGAPVGSPDVTNVTTGKAFKTNLLSGDFYIVPTNSCGLTVLQTLSTNVTTSTNVFQAGTNLAGNFSSQSLIEHFTNHVLQVTLCTNSPGTTNNSVVGDFQGIGRVQFVRVADDNYDYQTGQFYTPITNTYTMVVMKNGKPSTVTFQRVVTRPDILFMGENLTTGGNDVIFDASEYSRTTPNFINSRVAAGLAGPGIIDPTTSTNLTVIFNTVGPLYANVSPTLLTGPNARSFFIWGSFDGSTNPPIVYPNGTSILNLENEALMQISPAALPNATNGIHYSISLSASGGTPSYTWSLAAGSGALPAGLSLSPSGVISGTPTQTGTFDFVVQVTDSSYPTPLSVQINYSLTIN
jgi:hypothetical protein